jgi:uncharacterized phage protein (TIGR02216 family)
MFGEAARRLAGAAAALLGWTPDIFWQSTPAELCDALMPPGEAGEPPSRAAIDALMTRFPDQRGS